VTHNLPRDLQLALERSNHSVQLAYGRLAFGVRWRHLRQLTGQPPPLLIGKAQPMSV